MPAEFNDFGIRFLYPDNWTVAERDEEEGGQGLTLDLPSGGFVSIELTTTGAVDALIDKIVQAIAADYEDLEREDVSLELLPEGTPVTDLRFYYLDLLIISRIVVLPVPSGQAGLAQPERVGLDPVLEDEEVLVLQIQAESRDYDQNEAVFAAILKQIVDVS